MSQLLILSAVALLATFSGVLEGRADTIRGQTLPFGPRRKDLFDGVLNLFFLIAVLLNFFWIWQSIPWYASIVALVAMMLTSRFVITHRTIGRWIGVRPILAAAAGSSGAFLWLLFPPP
jgi:fatty acid desaturase